MRVVLEHQLARIDRLVAELLELAADREARPLGRDEQAHAGVARIGLRIGLHQHGEAMAFDAVGDPGLGAVDAHSRHCRRAWPTMRIACRSVPASGSVSARPPRISPEANLGSQCCLLARRAELLDGQRQHQVGVEDAGDRHPHRRDAHHDLGVGRGRQAEAAIFRADRGAEQAELLHLLDDLGRPLVGVVEFLHARRHLALDPPVDGGQQLGFVGLVDRVHPVLPASIMPDGRRPTRPRNLRTKP